MSRKSEDQSESSSKRAKPSTSSSPEVVAVNKNATPGFDEDLLRCPICSQFPRKEVYQYNSGHSVCANCLSKLRRCPTCRCLFKKVRNYLVEGLLDSMKFECSWKDFDCQEAPMARKDLTSHEAQCEFNPNSVEFCKIFEKSCNKKFCPVSTQDPVEMNIFLDHVKSEHGFTVQDVNLKESFVINLKYNWPGSLIWLGSMGKEQLTRTILRLKTTKTPQGPSRCQVWVILSHFALINLQPALLLKCVRLTDENKDNLSISFTMTAEQEKVGPGPQVPDLSWNVEPEGIRHLNEFLLGKPSDGLSSYHMIPDTFLRNYLTGRRITIKCVFTS